MANNKVMWIDSDWNVFKNMILGSSIKYLWKNGIDSNVTFLNSCDEKDACFLDQYLIEEFMKLYEDARKNEDDIRQRHFLRNKLLEIRNNANHFHNSSVVPYKKEYTIDDILDSIMEYDSFTYIIRMDLLSTDRDDLIEGGDRDYLSMGLHFYFKELLNQKCILFTENTDDDVIKKNWEKIYDKNYTKKLVLKRECK